MLNKKIKFENKYNQVTEGIVIDENYQCDWDKDLNGCIQVKVKYPQLGWVNTLIDKTQII